MTNHRDDQTMQLLDGRTLGYAEYGAPDGLPVFYFHGNPSSRLELSLMGDSTDELLAGLGLRMIAIDRPGCGLSTYKPGYRFTDWPADVCVLADRLGLAKFGVLSYSAGSPFALACAAQIPERLISVTIISGVSIPFAARDAMEGMGTSKIYWYSVRIHPWLTGKLLGMQVKAPRNAPPPSMAAGMAPLDFEVVSQPEVYGRFLEVSFVEACHGGTRGPAQEAALYWKPYGFRLEDIQFPVTWWHGSQDMNAPLSHARYAEKTLPHCTLHLVEGEGHVSLFFRRMEDVMKSLTAGVPRDKLIQD